MRHPFAKHLTLTECSDDVLAGNDLIAVGAYYYGNSDWVDLDGERYSVWQGRVALFDFTEDCLYERGLGKVAVKKTLSKMRRDLVWGYNTVLSQRPMSGFALSQDARREFDKFKIFLAWIVRQDSYVRSWVWHAWNEDCKIDNFTSGLMDELGDRNFVGKLAEVLNE